MKNIKFYKLRKSNEASMVSILYELRKLQEDNEKKISSLVDILVSAILSGISSWFIADKTIADKEEVVVTLIRLFAYFFIGIIVIRFFLWLWHNLKKCVEDNKKDFEKIDELKEYFYKIVLNNIDMGLSLMKKYEEESGDAKKNYAYEAFFYFELAKKMLSEKNIIEVSNTKRDNYTTFLKELNPYFLCQIFEVSIKSLEIIHEFSIENKDDYLKPNVEELINLYKKYISHVREQCKLS